MIKIEVVDFSITLTDHGYLCFGIVDDGEKVESISFFKNTIKECVGEFEAQVILKYEQPFELDQVIDNKFSQN